MGQGYKPQDPVSISEVRAEVIRSLQGSQEVLKHRVSSGDTLAMEDPQHIPC
jgi:hypothetical protein